MLFWWQVSQNNQSVKSFSTIKANLHHLRSENKVIMGDNAAYSLSTVYSTIISWELSFIFLFFFFKH